MPAQQPGVWGIDLGQCALKAIRVELIDGEVTATAFDYIEHPKILSQPDADPDQLTREAMEKFLSRNSLRGDFVVISVPGQSGLARFVKLPPVEEKKIVDIVRFEAKQQIPFPLEEVVWDYQKLGAGLVTDGYALETEIGLFAMKRDMVNRYLQHFKDVNVEVHCVQMAPLALCNFVAHDLLNKDPSGGGEDEGGKPAGKKDCVVALDIGTDNSNLVITDGERIIWQRPIPTGGNAFTRVLTKDLKLTFAKAEHLKRNAVKSPDLKKILTAIRPVLNDFVGEIQRSLGYFTNTHRDANILYLVALGNAFRLPGLQKFLQEKLGLEVRKLQKFNRLHGDNVVGAPQFTENVMSFAVAEGLALQGLKLGRLQTNLLPHEIRFERMVRAKKPVAVAAAAVLLLSLGVLGLGRAVESAGVDNKQTEVALEAGEAEAKRESAFQGQFQGELDNFTKSRDAVLRIAAGVDQQLNWNLLFEYIEDALPRPDGTKVPEFAVATAARPYNEYFGPKRTNSGEWAYKIWQRRQSDLEPASQTAKERAEEDLFLKQHLILVNIEAIDCRYSDDFGPFFEHLIKNLKMTEASLINPRGMRPDQAKTAAAGKEGGEGRPKSGWLIEIRGYTYHIAGEKLVVNTLVENLANPVPKGSKFKLSPAMDKQIFQKLSHVFLFQKKKVEVPDPVNFEMIGYNFAEAALAGTLKYSVKGGEEYYSPDPAKMGRGGAGPGEGGKGEGGTGGEGGTTAPAAKLDYRAGWQPIGSMSRYQQSTVGPGESGTKGRPEKTGVPEKTPGGTGEPGGTGVPGGTGTQPRQLQLPPRTEFVIFMIWQEPLPPDAQQQQQDPQGTPPGGGS